MVKENSQLSLADGRLRLAVVGMAWGAAYGLRFMLFPHDKGAPIRDRAHQSVYVMLVRSSSENGRGA